MVDDNETWDRRPRPEGDSAGQNNPGKAQDSPARASRREAKEWQLIEKIVLTHSNELKRSRRWGILFKSLTFIYLFALLYFLVIAPGTMTRGPVQTGGHMAIVEMHGQIADNWDISMETHREPLLDAFAHPDTQAVVLDINSPGGSPLQAHLLYELINDLKAEYPDIPVYAVVGEMAASGGYYIAAAADEIYAGGSSLVGSIGVISGSFGFDRALEELGIDRRIYTAGENKAFLDMFTPENEEAVAHWQTVLDSVHDQFLEAVIAGRGDRLDDSNPDVLSGFLWSGRQAVDNGLVDGIDSIYSLANRLEIEELLYFDPKRDPWRQILDDLGLAVGQGIGNAIQADRWFELR
ncbi:MAG: S49 family peptidase [Natronospirillum sp.]|uniref:S49 family peptidase n=1 Tax=Natronospirillum sp. TaxID=2812955 RepID=UPI0025E6DAF8|nr:S49 family peptidase [Natronospirillum sp.]MCH8550998.1 S49 family peptidase [Natronospirillum sp.]